MKGESVMANMDVSKYIMKRLENVNSSQVSSDLLSTNSVQSGNSIFNDISFANLENFDYSSAINALNSNSTDTLNQIENGDLSSIFQSLMSNDKVQSLADTDGIDGVSEDEAKAMMQSLAGLDGDGTTLSQDDIDSFIDNLGQTSEDDILSLIQEAFDKVEQEAEANKDNILANIQANNAAVMPDFSLVDNNVANIGSTSSVNSNYGTNNNYSTNSSSSSQTQTKTAADEVSELREQRKTIISTADKNIEDKQNEKDKLVANNKTLSSELKTEYSTQQKALGDIQSKLSSAESSLSSHKSSLADVEADIAALEGEKGTLKTDTNDSKINKENKSRLSELKKSIESKKEKKSKLSEKIKKEETQIESLKTKEKEQQKVVQNVEKQIGEESPSLRKNMDSLTKEISDLKSQKTKDVAEIDKKIEAKEKAQKKEAKQAGENKGKAANDIGSGLVALASKYMGKNESDGSYKMFTNGRTEAWCADFVTYVVKEYAKENGMKVADGFGSPAVSNLMSWAQKNGVFDNTSKMSDKEKLNYLQKNLSVGDVIIWKSNGASHTGIVKSINPDGTFTTVEGNSSDQVKSNKKSIYDRSLTGFIKLSDIVA